MSPVMTAAGRPKRLPLAMGLVSLLALGGCASLGGNIRGDFSCKAPDGICAPSSMIDDRALAMIAGEAMVPGAAAAGPYIEEGRGKARLTRAAATGPRTQIAAADPSRTQDKVLRIVFQPYVDERGRLHEASAVHAVVAQSEWQEEARANATVISYRNGQPSLAYESTLAEAVEHAAAGETAPGLDPNLPDEAAVAAARARGADPVGAIRADVAARLATGKRAISSPQPGGTQPNQAPVQKAPAAPTQDTITGSTGPASGTPVGRATGPCPPTSHVATTIADPAAPTAGAGPGSKAPALANVPKTTSGAEAAARVKADPCFATIARNVQHEARDAAQGAQLPDLKPVLMPTVGAASFPGTVPEDE